MKPADVRAKIDAILLQDGSPEAKQMLSLIARPKCACGGTLARRTNRCARCGRSEATDDQVKRRSDKAGRRMLRNMRDVAPLVRPGTAIFNAPSPSGDPS